MEQAVNSFIKGLQSDTHPMAQGNETMSDALNATIITSNGNEVILLNDMGNRRIEEAFLPSGYIPLGMKEYGGIIYVACYNPITNRGLVGSFPSPERNMIVKSNDNNNLSFKIECYNENEKCFLKEYDVIKVLFDGELFHAGDKFTIYNDTLWELLNLTPIGELYFSNFNNIFVDNDARVVKIKSPKNNYYTLSVGILNNENNFIDITKKLKRFELVYDRDNEEYVTQLVTDEFDDDVKFNTGYFIAKLEKIQYMEGDIEEISVDLARRMKGVNLYSQKLISPLCLKIHLNRPLEFLYAIKGTKTGENSCNLIITGILKYNCPDNSTERPEFINNKYYNYYDVPSLNNTNWFGFWINGEYVNNIDNEERNHVCESLTYNEDANLYTSVSKLTINNVVSDSNIIKYFIGVPTMLTKEYSCCDSVTPNPYIRSLSSFGTIDINNFDLPGLFTITRWLFITDNSNITNLYFSYHWNSDEETNVEVKLILNEVNGDDTMTLSLTGTNGENNHSLSLGNKFGKAYKVSIKYIGENTSGVINDYWILCTHLFDNAGNDNSSNCVGNDFVFPKTEDEIAVLQELLTIPFGLLFTNQSELNTVLTPKNFEGDWNEESWFPTPGNKLSDSERIKETTRQYTGYSDIKIEIGEITITKENYENYYPTYIINLTKNSNNIEISKKPVELENFNISPTYRTVKMSSDGTLTNLSNYGKDVNIAISDLEIVNDGYKFRISVDYKWNIKYKLHEGPPFTEELAWIVFEDDSLFIMDGDSSDTSLYIGSENINGSDSGYYHIVALSNGQTYSLIDDINNGTTRPFNGVTLSVNYINNTTKIYGYDDINNSNLSNPVQLDSNIVKNNISKLLNDKNTFVIKTGQYASGGNSYSNLYWFRYRNSILRRDASYGYIPFKYSKDTYNGRIYRNPFDFTKVTLLEEIDKLYRNLNYKVGNIYFPSYFVKGGLNKYRYSIVTDEDEVDIQNGSYYNYGIIVNTEINEVDLIVDGTVTIKNDPLNIFKGKRNKIKIEEGSKEIDFSNWNPINLAKESFHYVANPHVGSDDNYTIRLKLDGNKYIELSKDQLNNLFGESPVSTMQFITITDNNNKIVDVKRLSSCIFIDEFLNENEFFNKGYDDTRLTPIIYYPTGDAHVLDIDRVFFDPNLSMILETQYNSINININPDINRNIGSTITKFATIINPNIKIEWTNIT